MVEDRATLRPIATSKCGHFSKAYFGNDKVPLPLRPSRLIKSACKRQHYSLTHCASRHRHGEAFALVPIMFMPVMPVIVLQHTTGYAGLAGRGKAAQVRCLSKSHDTPDHWPLAAIDACRHCIAVYLGMRDLK